MTLLQAVETAWQAADKAVEVLEDADEPDVGKLRSGFEALREDARKILERARRDSGRVDRG